MSEISKGVRRLRRAAASEYLKEAWGLDYAPRTLAKLFSIGGGPTARKAGRYPLYEEPDLDAWAESKIGPRVRSSSEVSQAAPAAA